MTPRATSAQRRRARPSRAATAPGARRGRRPRVLVIDDGIDYAAIVADRMPEFELVRPKQAASAPPCIGDGPEALRYLEKNAGRIDVVLLDLHFDVAEDRLLSLGEDISLRRTKRFQGVAILRELRKRHPSLPVVLLTALEDLSLVDVDGELAAQSLVYFLDSDDLDTLRIRINAALQEVAQGLEEAGILWGGDRRMQGLRRRLGVLARGAMPMILEGETGTGKSFLAERFIHRNSGRDGPFVVLDLATIPRDLVPAHLFGALRGAFTGAVADRKGVFEIADRGTLFIDEIQNVPLEVQKQLLLVLQDRRVRPLGATKEVDVDVKVIAGSNESLERAVAEGRFRQDLYMRLGPATRIELPPLRERSADIAFFARRFVEIAAEDPDNTELRRIVAFAAGVDPSVPLQLRIGRGGDAGSDGLQLVLPKPAWTQLGRHRWPGNMRELAMVMHNLVAFTLVAAVDALHQGLPVRSPRLQIDPGLVGSLLAAAAPGRTGADSGSDQDIYQVRLSPARSLNALTTDVERQFYRTLFEQTRGDFAQMAEVMLGDPTKARAVRLRFNQIGLRVRELRT